MKVNFPNFVIKLVVFCVINNNNNSLLSLPSLCVLRHRSRHNPIQKVRGEEQASSATPARLPGFSRLHFHRLFLSPFLLSLLQRVWFSFPSLQVPFLLLRALTHLLQPGDPFGRGRWGPKYRENAPQAQAEPQLATWALGKPSEGVGFRLRAAAAGSVRQQRVHGLTPKLTIRGRLSENGRKTRAEWGWSWGKVYAKSRLLPLLGAQPYLLPWSSQSRKEILTEMDKNSSWSLKDDWRLMWNLERSKKTSWTVFTDPLIWTVWPLLEPQGSVRGEGGVGEEEGKDGWRDTGHHTHTCKAKPFRASSLFFSMRADGESPPKEM